MAKRRFHVVKTDDPAAVFDDLDALQQEKPVVATKRARRDLRPLPACPGVGDADRH